MRGYVILILFLWLGNGYAAPHITAKSAIIMNSKSGEVIYSKNPFMKLPPASTTKIMTAILALENLSLDKRLRVSSRAVAVSPSKLYLKRGDYIRVRDLLYSLLLKSANDAAIVLAEGVAGSLSVFSEMMNKKAKEIGAFNSHFVNPHGLPAHNHYSTAYDLAVIFRYAMKNPVFKEIVRTKVARIRIRKNRIKFIRNHNKLLWMYKGAEGGKTGYTKRARHCFVGEVKRGGVSFIISLLGSRNIWGDARRLLEYGFKFYSSRLKRASRNTEKKGYVLQVASFKHKELALRLKNRLRQKGYNAYIILNLINGERFYRVMIGRYKDIYEARSEIKRINLEEKLKPIVIID